MRMRGMLSGTAVEVKFTLVNGFRVAESATVRATASGTSAIVSGFGAYRSHTYPKAAFSGTGEPAWSAAVTGHALERVSTRSTVDQRTIRSIRTTGATSSRLFGEWSGSKNAAGSDREAVGWPICRPPHSFAYVMLNSFDN